MKAHVLTMRHSASSGSVVRGNPASVSMPSISSESTWFLGQPRVVRWTFMSEAQYTLAHRRGPRRPPPSQTRLERASPAARRGVLRLALPRHPQDRLARSPLSKGGYSNTLQGPAYGPTVVSITSVRLVVFPLFTWTKIVTRSFPTFVRDRKSTRLNSSHLVISYAVFCLKKKKKKNKTRYV